MLAATVIGRLNSFRKLCGHSWVQGPIGKGTVRVAMNPLVVTKPDDTEIILAVLEPGCSSESLKSYIRYQADRQLPNYINATGSNRVFISCGV